MACFDFPEVVVHDHDGTCPRYKKGGVCRPLPTPIELYTEEEQRYVDAYGRFMAVIRGETPPPKDWSIVRPKGTTLYPPEDIHD